MSSDQNTPTTTVGQTVCDIFVAFIMALWPIFPGNAILCLWTRQWKQTYPFDFPADLHAAAAQVEYLAQYVLDVYFAVSLQAELPAPGRRGDEAGVSAVPGLWLDLDIAGPNHKQTALPQTEEEALEFLADFQLRPSIIVNSGGGLQAYWCFRKPLTVADDAERAQAKNFSERFQRHLLSLGHDRGWKLDSTPNLDRLLRVPGTFNYKDPSNPRQVRVLHLDPGCRYSVEEIEAVLPAEPTKTKSKANLPATREARSVAPAKKYPPADARRIVGACAWVAYCIAESFTLPEPVWHAFLSIISRCENNRALCHEYSSPYPNYNFDETERKIDQVLNNAGPRTCANIRANCAGEEFCLVCPHWERVRSPIMLGYEPGALKAFFTPSVQQVQPGVAVAVNNQGELAKTSDPAVPQLTRHGVLMTYAELLYRQGSTPDAIRTALHAENLAKCNPPLEVQEVEELADKILHQLQGFGNEGGTVVESIVGTGACVPGLVVPARYTITPQGHIMTLGKGPKGVPQYITVSTTFFFIKALYIDMGTGLSSVELAWLVNGKVHSIIVERSKISDTKPIILLSNYNIPIHTNNAKIVIQYLADSIAANQHRLPTYRCTSKLGWQGESGIFMLGHTMIAKAGTNPQPITFIGRDTGDEQVAAGYHTKGTLEGWIEAFNIIKNFPIPLFYLLVALSVPFMKWLECANKTVDNCKKTSTGKTISLANSASAYGKPIRKAKDTCLHVWDTTKVAIGRIMSVINDLPLFIDDTSKAPTPEIVKDAIYSVEAGRDKARGTIYGLAVTEWFTIMALTNGEQPAVSFTKNHAGAYARTLTIQEAPFGNESNSRRVKRVRSSVEKNYGHVAPIVIQFIADHDADYGLWEAAYEDAKEFYSDKAEGNEIADRMSDLIALVATTAPLIFKAVPQMKLEKPIAELLEYIWQFLEQGAHEADRPLEAFKAFWDWAVRNQRKFFSTKKNVEGEEEDESFEPNLGWYGRWDETHKFPHIGVTRAALEKALKDAGYDLDAVIGAWADNGWIMLRRDGKRQRTVDIGKAKVGCYCFTFKTIDDVLGVKEEN